MANECDFRMRVTGRRRDIEEFLGVIDIFSKNRQDRQIWGVLLTKPEKKDILTQFEKISDDDITTYEIEGFCRWSVYSAMLEGEYTDYEDYKDSKEHNITSLIKESELLNLVIEVYGSEPGLGFEEYFFIKFGKIEMFEAKDFDENNDQTKWSFKSCEDLFINSKVQN